MVIGYTNDLDTKYFRSRPLTCPSPFYEVEPAFLSADVRLETLAKEGARMPIDKL
jgi:hypothetical protein